MSNDDQSRGPLALGSSAGLERAEPKRADGAELLMQLVSDTPRCMALLDAMDKAAKEESKFEYGLPLWDDAHAARLREVLYKWACGAL